ncbi:hypothetical protein MST22_15600 [Virgibacillus halodenitrificans]|uniref:hypothetical protein n=1 Tax=Virgibacillus halodenitrificans TaxID=1482 RepID=UPI001FB23A72|nr:hypothetical protein [Virgibacillus halodenitrificans]MCJ0932572.1 hypothetical protein [Virgibacillus halodenitrificans]
MKTIDVLEESKKSHIIEQLNGLKYFDTEDKSYNELKHKLAVLRALQVDVSKDENRWF